MTSPATFSRRRFLVQTAVLSSAPFVLAGRSAQAAPGERINLGFVGLGVQGRGLMGGFLGHREVQVVAVCDVDSNRREDGRKRAEGFYAQKTDRGSFKGCAAFEAEGRGEGRGLLNIAR